MVSSIETRAAELPIGDDAFGPILQNHFDFTLLFQYTIFSLLPSLLLITSCPVYIFVKRQQTELVKRNKLFWIKLILGCLLVLVQLAQLATWATTLQLSSARTWGIIAGSFSCIAALCITIMLSYEHRHGLRSSALLSSYFALILILDAIRARSYFLRPSLHIVGAIQVVVSVTNALLLLVEEIPKSSGLIDLSLREKYGPESFFGLWSQALCLPTNRTLSTGYKRVLTVEDFANIGPEFDTTTLFKRFEESWLTADKKRPWPLIKTLVKLHHADIIAVMPPRILFSVCSLAQPVLFFHALDIMHKHDLPAHNRHGIVIGTILIYAGMLLFRSMYTQQNIRLAAFTRGILQAKIYHKSLLLRTEEASKGAAITHCTADVEAIITGVQKLHDWWLSFFELGFIMYVLYLYVGYACFLLFIPTCLSTVWATYFGPRAGAARRKWNDAIESRVTRTVHILSQAKQVKILGLDSILAKFIQGLRIAELRASQRFRAMQSVVTSMVMVAACFTPVIVIAGGLFLTKIPVPLEAQRMFAILAVILLAEMPFKNILRVYTELASLVSCFGRIQDYLLLEERHDGRQAVLPLSELGSEKRLDIVLSEDTAPIRLTDAALSPLPRLSPILHGLNVSIPPSKLTIATGATGSGKSTFLRSLLGEANIADGRVFVRNARTAFCTNKAWLFSGSIRDNIVAMSLFEEEWYCAVLECCCLQEDISKLPNGDQTDVSNNGLNLSGGQRQRIALARAVYSRPQLLILDDVFSALDKTTSSRIFNSLFQANGLLRKLRTTVILATHQLEFLDMADLILHFDETGHVSARQSTPKQCLDHLVATDPEKTQKVNTGDKPTENSPGNVSTKNDKFHKSDRSVWAFFFKHARRSLFVIFLTITVLNTICERLPAAWMRVWVGRYAGERRMFAVFGVFGILPTFTYLGMAISFFQFLVPEFAESMHKMLVETLFGSTLSHLTSTNHGELINRVSQHMTLVTQQFAMDFFLVPYATASLLADLVVVSSSSYYSIAVLPPLVLILFLVQRLYLRTSRQIRLLELDAVTPMYTQLGEALSGLEYIRAYGWQQHYLARAFTGIDMLQRPAFQMQSIQRWLQVTLDGIGFGLAVVLMCLALYLGENIAKGGVGFGFIGIISLNDNAMFFIQQWVSIEASLGAVSSLQKFIQETPQEPDNQSTGLDSESVTQPSAPKLQFGPVRFEHVTATYKSDTSSHVALHDASLEIPEGTTVGVVGRTGSGKSSLFLALLNLVEYEGVIKINGQDISQASRQELRSFITSIPQDCLRLPGTIRQNLMPWLLIPNVSEGRDVDESVVHDALVSLGLSSQVHAAGGLDTNMEELGLSAGEEQLFSIARSSLTRLHTSSRLVLMDEPTCNMDVEKDKKVQKLLKATFAGCTVLHISHREQAVADSDAIFEIENGVIKLKESEQPGAEKRPK